MPRRLAAGLRGSAPTIRDSKSTLSAAPRASYSARYAGAGADDAANNAKLLRELSRASRWSGAGRATAARWCSCPRRGGPAPLIAEGVWEGRILDAPRGSGGFGYDPYFWLPELELTAARARPRRQESAEPPRHGNAGAARAAAGARRGRRARDRSVARPVRAHAVVRAQMPVLRFQFASIEVGAPRRAYIDALIRRFRHGICRASRAAASTPCSSAAARPACSRPRTLRACWMHCGSGSSSRPTSKSPWRPTPGPSSAADSRATRDAGINRVSLGAQTFAPRALERLGRIHSAEDTHRAVAELRAAKLDNFNLDLMYALPEQTARGGAQRRAHRLRAGARAHLLLPTHARARHGIPFAPAAAARRGCGLADADRGSEVAGGGRLRAIRSVGVCAGRARAAGTTSITGCSAITSG